MFLALEHYCYHNYLTQHNYHHAICSTHQHHHQCYHYDTCNAHQHHYFYPCYICFNLLLTTTPSLSGLLCIYKFNTLTPQSQFENCHMNLTFKQSSLLYVYIFKPTTTLSSLLLWKHMLNSSTTTTTTTVLPVLLVLNPSTTTTPLLLPPLLCSTC